MVKNFSPRNVRLYQRETHLQHRSGPDSRFGSSTVKSDASSLDAVIDPGPSRMPIDQIPTPIEPLTADPHLFLTRGERSAQFDLSTLQVSSQYSDNSIAPQIRVHVSPYSPTTAAFKRSLLPPTLQQTGERLQPLSYKSLNLVPSISRGELSSGASSSSTSGLNLHIPRAPSPASPSTRIATFHPEQTNLSGLQLHDEICETLCDQCMSAVTEFDEDDPGWDDTPLYNEHFSGPPRGNASTGSPSNDFPMITWDDSMTGRQITSKNKSRQSSTVVYATSSCGTSRVQAEQSF